MKISIKYPSEALDKPIFSTAILKTNTKVNVLRATIDGVATEMLLDVEDSKVKKFTGLLESYGINVSEIRQGIYINTELCIDCGACCSLCPTKALYMEDDSLKLDESKCILCKNCIQGCWVGALEMRD